MAKTSRALLLATALVLFVPLPGTATQRYGPVEMSGNLQSQNLVRHPDDAHFQFIQNRNTAHLQLEYDWVLAGQFSDTFTITFNGRSRPTIKYRRFSHSIDGTRPDTNEKGAVPG